MWTAEKVPLRRKPDRMASISVFYRLVSLCQGGQDQQDLPLLLRSSWGLRLLHPVPCIVLLLSLPLYVRSPPAVHATKPLFCLRGDVPFWWL